MIDSFVPGIAVGLVLGGGMVWMSMRAGRALDRHTLDTVKADREGWEDIANERLGILNNVEKNLLDQIRSKQEWITRAYDAEHGHSRCADALSVCQERIEEALLQETKGANSTVKRICAILRGER